MFLNYLERIFIEPTTGNMSVMGFLLLVQLLLFGTMIAYRIKVACLRYQYRKARPSYNAMTQMLASSFHRKMGEGGFRAEDEQCLPVMQALTSSFHAADKAFRVPSEQNTNRLPLVCRRVIRSQVIGKVIKGFQNTESYQASFSGGSKERLRAYAAIREAAVYMVDTAFAMSKDFGLPLSPPDMCILLREATKRVSGEHDIGLSAWWVEDYAKDSEVSKEYRMPELVEAEELWTSRSGVLTLMSVAVSVAMLLYVCYR